jgi:teichuronic acid exporter
MKTLKQKSIAGMFWTGSERILLQLVSLVISVILARLLEPSKYGLISMLAIFTSIARVLLDSGYGKALIQKKDADQTDASSVFYFNIIIGIILTAILFLSAPFISTLFSQPILIPVTRVLSLSLFIHAFSLVPNSLLIKKLDFKTQLKVNIISTIVSGLIGILMAYLGFGVWSLVSQILLGSIIQAALLWVFFPWRPALVFSFCSIKSMFSFGSRLLVSSLLISLYSHIYQVFIGIYYSAADLGFFSKANNLTNMASHVISDPLGKVTLPVMSVFQDNIPQQKIAFQKMLRLSVFLQFPLMIGLWVLSEPLILLLLTDRWAPTIPYFQLLCVPGLIFPLHTLNLNILLVNGRSDLFFRLEVIKKILGILSIAVTYRWGIIGLLYGKIVADGISYFVNSYYSGHLIDYSQWRQIRDIIPSFLVALIMGTILYFVRVFQITNNLITIFVQVFMGIVIYFIISNFTSPNETLEVKLLISDVFDKLLSKLKPALCIRR